MFGYKKKFIFIKFNKDSLMKGLCDTRVKRFRLHFWYSRLWCCYRFRYFIMVRKIKNYDFMVWFLFQCEYEWCFKCGWTSWRIGTILVHYDSYEVRIPENRIFLFACVYLPSFRDWKVGSHFQFLVLAEKFPTKNFPSTRVS